MSPGTLETAVGSMVVTLSPGNPGRVAGAGAVEAVIP